MGEDCSYLALGCMYNADFDYQCINASDFVPETIFPTGCVGVIFCFLIITSYIGSAYWTTLNCPHGEWQNILMAPTECTYSTLTNSFSIGVCTESVESFAEAYYLTCYGDCSDNCTSEELGIGIVGCENLEDHTSYEVFCGHGLSSTQDLDDNDGNFMEWDLF